MVLLHVRHNCVQFLLCTCVTVFWEIHLWNVSGDVCSWSCRIAKVCQVYNGFKIYSCIESRVAIFNRQKPCINQAVHALFMQGFSTSHICILDRHKVDVIKSNEHRNGFALEQAFLKPTHLPCLCSPSFYFSKRVCECPKQQIMQ